MIDYTMLDKRIDELQGELIADIQKWVSIPSVQGAPEAGKPFGGVVASMLDLALETGRKYGFETRNVDYYAGDISMGSGEETMGMLAHLDVVPAGEGWHHDPFGGEIADGRIFGRGTIDDKGSALCALYAMRAVKECGIPLKDGVRLILGCDEETGMSDMRYYASKYKMPDYGFSPDAEFPLINIEKGGVNALLIRDCEGEADADIPVLSIHAGKRPNVVPAYAEAVVDYRKAGFDRINAQIEEIAKENNWQLRAKDLGDGTACISADGILSHGSLPENGLNACGIVLIALNKMNAGGGSREAIRFAAEKLGLEPDGASLNIKQADELSHHLSCNMGIVNFDGKRFEITLDIRYPLCATESDIMGNICMAASDYGFAVSCISHHTPLHVPAEHKIVRGLLKVYNEIMHADAKPLAIGGGTYSRMMPNTVAFGVVFPDQEDCCHIADEYIEIDRLTTIVRLYAHAIVELAGGHIQ